MSTDHNTSTTTRLIDQPDIIASRALAHRDELRDVPATIRTAAGMLRRDLSDRHDNDATPMTDAEVDALLSLIETAARRLGEINIRCVGEDDSDAAPERFMRAPCDTVSAA
ncbi:hypothetical protein TVNIR_2094 [Thioalkalivibrio nitratireducens DSM 14787]|uniref:Uncharacterized protein n=1 Tax=Thioalkalivibrio nitratireducens (strain DSM 14787 / UNIQEM 213 / ALEN2) TaxID=1255043 RepID=L0DVX8_THIND|nr:hypothetical protein [Thioalkalivibrio nitratireducens]AGA33754.1 hypothetical protein TVNIR_2094 [Thioalkalivibrio nitratireducens DSM 14787]